MRGCDHALSGALAFGMSVVAMDFQKAWHVIGTEITSGDTISTLTLAAR